MNFKQLGLNAAILKALEAQRYQTPTPIQSGAIPPALIGRDVLGIAQTGTGKTCAFATPILQRLALKPQSGKPVIRSLILTPTRELALQIEESFEAYGANLPLKSAVIFGGVGQQPQVDKLRRGVDILVATPGRLLDLQGQGLLDLSHVEIFVLDEADRMLDMGFIHDVRRVLKLLPEKKQTLFFSATMPPEVQSLVNALLHDPAKVTVTPVSSPVEVIDQTLYFVDKPNKSKLLAHLVSQPGVKNALVFSRTKHGANKIASDLIKSGISAAAIHGNKSQTARVQALGDFKAGRIKVLAATDIAARGIDIEELSHVFNYNLPDVPETYVHRIGRTGRAGHGGTAISFCDISEKDELKGIEKLLGKHIPVVEDHPWPMTNFEPPKRDKNGKIINPEDAEARQAARERKRERRQAAVDGPERGRAEALQKPKTSPSRRGERAPVGPELRADRADRREAPAKSLPNASVTAPKAKPPKPAKDQRTPKEKRQSAGYKASHSLDEALRAVSPRTEEADRDDAFERWMAEERRIQAQQGYSDALAGDEIMDATARLLAPKRPSTPARSVERSRSPQQRREERRDERQPRREEPRKAKPAQQKTQKPQKPAAQKPAKPVQSAKPAQSAVQPAPAKKSLGQVVKSALSLDERKARIREQAKARRGMPPERPKTSAGQMDSTEHASLMKPYYLNDD